MEIIASLVSTIFVLVIGYFLIRLVFVGLRYFKTHSSCPCNEACLVVTK